LPQPAGSPPSWPSAEADELALDAYGRYLGIAFQLADDAIDYDSDASEMGKDQGDDFREGKMTLPVILAYARGSEDERAFWREAIAGNRNSDEDLATAIALIRKHDAVQATRERARDYAQRAIDAIARFPTAMPRQPCAKPPNSRWPAASERRRGASATPDQPFDHRDLAVADQQHQQVDRRSPDDALAAWGPGSGSGCGRRGRRPRSSASSVRGNGPRTGTIRAPERRPRTGHMGTAPTRSGLPRAGRRRGHPSRLLSRGPSMTSTFRPCLSQGSCPCLKVGSVLGEAGQDQVASAVWPGDEHEAPSAPGHRAGRFRRWKWNRPVMLDCLAQSGAGSIRRGPAGFMAGRSARGFLLALSPSLAKPAR
jgi:hypothetical protein